MKDSNSEHKKGIKKKMNQNPISIFHSKSDKKTIEKHRRNQMKALYCKLFSLVPPQSSKEINSFSEQLGEAESYIKKLQERLEVMKQKRDLLKVRESANLSSSFCNDSGADGLKLPRLEVHATGSTLDVVLITGTEHRHMFKKTVGILIEEGADVVSAVFSVVDQTMFHTIYSKIGGSGLENEAARIFERLRKFVADEY